MKKIFFLFSIILLFLPSCNLDFNNKTSDEWIIYNNTENYNSNNPLIVKFNTDEKTITEKITTLSAPENAKITINESYHVNFVESYSYSSTPSKRKLTITDQTKYTYKIINNTSNKLYIFYKDVTTEVEATSNITLVEYKTKPTYSIYYLNGTEKIYYSDLTEQLSGKSNYTITIN